jgi:hypothetical protein
MDRFVCYSCGERLDKIPDGVPMPGERSYPCLNCGTRMTAVAKACPGCGLIPASLNAVAVTTPTNDSPPTNFIDRLRNAPYPIDWNIEPYPDGTVSLQKNGFAGFNQALPFAVPIVVACLMLFMFSFARGWSDGSFGPNVILIVLLRIGLGLLLFGTVAYSTFTRIELRAGPNFLEIRRRFLWWESVKRITTIALFRVETIRDDNRMVRTLVVENLGGRYILDSITTGDYKFLLHTYGALSTDTPDAPSSLGRFLAAQTGWQFTDSLSRGNPLGRV